MTLLRRTRHGRIFTLQAWQHSVLCSMQFLFRWLSEHVNTINMQYVQSRRSIFFVKSYYSTQKNLKEILRLCGEQFNVLRPKWPSKSVVIRTMKKFKTTGSVHDNKAGKVGAKQTAWSEENIDQARNFMHATP